MLPGAPPAVMKLHVLSDLHLEFGPISLPETDADVVILAGDLHIKQNGIRWIRENLEDKEVIYLAGNHEYYGEKFPGLIQKLKTRAEGTNIRVLENDPVEIGGYRFYGCTLWTDLNLFGDTVVGAVDVMAMNDYKRVRQSVTYRKLAPSTTRAHHLASVAGINAFLASGDPQRSIIVTHHAPSIRSTPEHRRQDRENPAYASHLDGLIERTQPALWIHGHIHDSQDYRIGQTRIVSNPRGYLDDPNKDFDPGLVIELPA